MDGAPEPLPKEQERRAARAAAGSPGARPGRILPRDGADARGRGGRRRRRLHEDRNGRSGKRAGAPQAPSRPAEDAGGGGTKITTGGSIVDCGFSLSSEATQRPDVAPLFIDAVETSGYPGAVERKSFALDGGSGTHLQAPAHYVVGGRSIDRFSTDELVDVPLVLTAAHSHADLC